MTYSDTTVCIKTFLRDAQLYRCIDTLVASYPDIKILVADDGKVDKSEEMQRRGIRYWFAPFNSLGLTKGRNLMLDNVETPYFVICDDDSVWSAECQLEKLKKMLDVSDLAGGTVSLLGNIQHYEGDLIRSDDNGLIYSALNMNDLASYDGIQFARVDLVDEYYIAKTEKFKGKKIWDENLRVTYEHVDSFMTMREKGINVVYVPECVIGHKSPDLLQTDEYLGHRLDVGTADGYRNYLLNKWGYDYLVFFNGSRENKI